MNRKYYTFTDLKKLIPELAELASPTIDIDTTQKIVEHIDIWAAKNNLALFQIITPTNGAAIFIFNMIPTIP